MTEEVVTARQGEVAYLHLNRPQALNALNLDMCEAMTSALLGWRTDPLVRAVIIDHVTERGFCAGGDVRTIASSIADGGEAGRIFFHAEYQLDHLISAMGKPVVTVMDGVTVGGGVGISLPATFRIATERTLFAMPETTIGLFPDVGGGWWLPRLPGKTGLWLALTGSRLKARACVELGLATHFVPSESLPALKEEIERRPGEIDAVLADFATEAPGPVLQDREAIDTLFNADSLEGVFDKLKADNSPFAVQTLETLSAKSPLSMAVAFRQLSLMPASLAEDLVMEYRLAARIILQPDFAEGVRALLIDKDNRPVWRPPACEALLDSIFAPLPDGQEWTPHPALKEPAQ